MQCCDVCDVDLGGVCDHCGNRACESCVRICDHCDDICCCQCYDDETDMCLTCKESGCEGEKEEAVKE